MDPGANRGSVISGGPYAQACYHPPPVVQAPPPPYKPCHRPCRAPGASRTAPQPSRPGPTLTAWPLPVISRAHESPFSSTRRSRGRSHSRRIARPGHLRDVPHSCTVTPRCPPPRSSHTQEPPTRKQHPSVTVKFSGEGRLSLTFIERFSASPLPGKPYQPTHSRRPRLPDL